MQVVVVKLFSHTSVVPCTSTTTHEAFGMPVAEMTVWIFYKNLMQPATGINPIVSLSFMYTDLVEVSET